MTAFQFLLAFSIGVIFGVIFGVFVMGMMRMARLGEDEPPSGRAGDVGQHYPPITVADFEAWKRAHGHVVKDGVIIFGTGEAYDPDAWRHADIKRPHVQD